jgi:glutamyl-Q tRNA(Asp) synthetase
MACAEPAPYVGRFAPSPTGPLHFGSLLAAVASYLQARTAGGKWLLRIEDIDPPREQPGADSLILTALEAYGFEWDGAAVYQGKNTARHLELVDQLLEKGLAYPCSCSRRDLATARRGPLGTVYPGTCRTGCRPGEAAVRVRIDDRPVTFDDLLQGRQEQDLVKLSGDFIIKRRDGLIAYHLAVVADDNDQGITEIVRGIDLLDSTPRQIYLQQQLSFSTPDYLHIPVVLNRQQQKLSKLTGASAIPLEDPAPILFAALNALGQRPHEGLAASPVTDLWSWAIENWHVEVMLGARQIEADQDPLAKQQNGLS